MATTGNEKCIVPQCRWHTGGIANGAGPMLCKGYGDGPPECAANWLNMDPEDREPYFGEAAKSMNPCPLKLERGTCCGLPGACGDC
jgi:hypothetical protein